MSRILAPHKEQDGWVYWRMRPAKVVNGEARVRNWAVVARNDETKMWEPIPFNYDEVGLGYYDNIKGSRIISSRRVEEAVETADYLGRCAEEGLCIAWAGRDGSWCVTGDNDSQGVFGLIGGDWPKGYGRTLREAYHRYKGASHE